MRQTNRSFIRTRTFRLSVLLCAWIWCIHSVSGADPTVSATTASPRTDAGPEHFVPHGTRIECSGSIQMLKAVEVAGNTIRVRDIARWSDTDSDGFSTIADLVIDHFDDAGTRRISLDTLRSTLSGAGVNLSQVNFAGPTACLVTHNASAPVVKPPANDRDVVLQWMDEKSKKKAEVSESKLSPDAARAAVLKAVTDSGTDEEQTEFHSLREMLLKDLSQRLNLPADELQVTFETKDRSFLNLSEPMFHFDLSPRRLTDLGKISWDLTISSGKNQQKMTINAEARCWEKQVIAAKAIGYHQVLRDEDCTERRVLVDHIESDPLLTRAQMVGQQAARDIKPGMLLTSRMLDPIPMVKQGEVVTVTLTSGGISIRTVATAMEPGSFGQSIKVRSEQNQNVFVVTMTGPQTATMGVTPATDPAAVSVAK